MVRPLFLSLGALSLLLFANQEVKAEETSERIYGGQVVQTCQWPTAIALQSGNSLCTGTLVHPRVVLTAAHCINGSGSVNISFGESSNSPSINPSVEYCRQNPGYIGSVGEDDYGYCLLSDAVEGIPPTPPLMGCETKILVKDTPVTLVGFGVNESGQAGIKRSVDTQIASEFALGTVWLGGDGESSCQGDSGGPAYIQLEDGAWRVFGITSGGNADCADGGQYVTVHTAIPWIEEDSGIDVTPCFKANGQWDTGDPNCTGYATDPRAGGSWTDRCDGELSGTISTCGPSLEAPDDTTPPTVVIASPADGDVFEEIPSVIDVDIDPADDDGDEWGVQRVELYVDDTFVVEVKSEPFIAEYLTFPAGSYSLTAHAFDYWGNETVSDPVSITIGDGESGDELADEDGGAEGDSAEDDGGENGADEDGDGEGDDGGTSAGADEDGDGESASEGCGCRSDGGNNPAPFAALALLTGLGLRLRRRRRA